MIATNYQVTAPEVPDLEAAIDNATGEITSYEGQLARADRRGRYLNYLATRDETEDMRDDCLICMGSSEDKYGIFLECGHFFCDVRHLYASVPRLELSDN